MLKWAPDIPPTWDVVNLKMLARIFAGGTPDRKNADYWSDGTVPWLNSGSVNDWAISKPSELIAREALANGATRWAPKGAVLVALAGQGKTKGMAARLEIDSTLNQSLAAIVPGASLDYRFLQYWLTSNYLNIRGLAGGDLRDGLNLQHIGSIQVPRPPVEKQRAIANYLDRETAQIDAFIAKNEELIALLTEGLSAVVDGVMAELGFAEPDDLAISREHPLPESWRIISLGSLLLQLTNGYVGPTRDILVDDGIRYIQGTHIKKGKIDFLRRPFFVTRTWHDERPRIHLREGDVLIVQTGDIGKVAVVPPGFGEASCHALQIARVNRRIIDPQFLGAYLSSRFGYHQLTSRATGALHLHLEASIKSAPVVVPPLHVQAQIVRKVRERESQIESAIGTAERLIALSKERRAALISAAVTGKIDVGVPT